MRVALSVSTVGHAAIIAWGLVSLSGAAPLDSMAQQPLPVDLVSIEELTALKAGAQDGEDKAEQAAPEPVEEARPADVATPEPKPARQQSTAPEISTAPPEKPQPTPPQTETAALPPEPAPPAAAPEPEPAPAPQPSAEPEPAPAPPAPADVPLPPTKPKLAERPQTPPPPAPAREEPPRPEPQRQPSPPDNAFDADRIAALLSKVPNAGGAPAAETVDETASLGTRSGDQASLSLSEIDALRAQIARCWNPPIGVLDAGPMVVRIGLDLNVDGSLAGPPAVLNATGDPVFMLAAEAAVRAIAACQPYSLPQHKYDLWRQIHVNFDPRDMLG